jgi:hypothetical protein
MLHMESVGLQTCKKSTEEISNSRPSEEFGPSQCPRSISRARLQSSGDLCSRLRAYLYSLTVHLHSNACVLYVVALTLQRQ